MITQEPLFFDCAEDAARHVVQVLGGAKTIGVLLRPAKSPDQAARWLLDCLNTDRPEHLQMADFIWLAREGRKIGCHALVNYLASEAGYAPPQPMEPQDEQARLMREFIAAANVMRHILPRIEDVSGLAEMQANIRPVK